MSYPRSCSNKLSFFSRSSMSRVSIRRLHSEILRLIYQRYDRTNSTNKRFYNLHRHNIYNNLYTMYLNQLFLVNYFLDQQTNAVEYVQSGPLPVQRDSQDVTQRLVEDRASPVNPRLGHPADPGEGRNQPTQYFQTCISSVSIESRLMKPCRIVAL